MLGFKISKPVIGVVHLDPLPGSPRFNKMETVVDNAIRDAKRLENGGINGLIIENFGDVPFEKSVNKLTVSALTKLTDEVKRNVDIPIGINVLRNDWKAALSISKVLGLDFIRVNVFTGLESTAEGLIEGNAAKAQRFRERNDIDSFILADIQVKHGKKLYPEDIVTDAVESTERGLADGVIVSGEATGKAVKEDDLKKVKKAVEVPVIIGSGSNPENLSELLTHSDGAIVGTYLKEDGKVSNPVSKERVRKIMNEVTNIRKK